MASYVQDFRSTSAMLHKGSRVLQEGAGSGDGRVLQSHSFRSCFAEQGDTMLENRYRKQIIKSLL